MRIQTYSVMVGGTACNCRCPRCVSQMTPSLGVRVETPKVNWRNFLVGCKFARANGVSTALLTGKGEPTLYPELVLQFVERLAEQGFSFIELQTNGFLLANPDYRKILHDWYGQRLTTVAISMVHYDDALNIKGMRPVTSPKCGLAETIVLLHEVGFSVRLSCILERGYIEFWPQVRELINFAQANKVEQLSVRSVEMSADNTQNQEVAKYVRKHKPGKKALKKIQAHLESGGKPLLHLVHGAVVYDYAGQNICLTNCLTRNTDPEEVRQLIFFPDGHLRYDWVYPGAILL